MAAQGGTAQNGGENSTQKTTSNNRKAVKLHYTIDEDDSDQFPLEADLECFDDLKEALQILLHIKKGIMISVVLEHQEVIVNLNKVTDAAEYRVTKKVKENFVRVFLRKM